MLTSDQSVCERFAYSPHRVLCYLQTLLCLPACQGVQQVREHQGRQELQGRQQVRCYLALPTGGHKVITYDKNNLCRQADVSVISKLVPDLNEPEASHLDSSRSVSTRRSI